jgi:hypothetical protein
MAICWSAATSLRALIRHTKTEIKSTKKTKNQTEKEKKIEVNGDLLVNCNRSACADPSFQILKSNRQKKIIKKFEINGDINRDRSACADPSHQSLRIHKRNEAQNLKSTSLCWPPQTRTKGN